LRAVTRATARSFNAFSSADQSTLSQQAKSDEAVRIIKAREPARIIIAIVSEDRWRQQLAQRWIVQHNFYTND
jgi:hypothetical protein